VKHLVEVDVLERVTDSQPHRYCARRVDMTIQTGEATSQLSQTLLVCLGYPNSSDNIALYIERHGVSGLATAVLVSAPTLRRYRREHIAILWITVD